MNRLFSCYSFNLKQCTVQNYPGVSLYSASESITDINMSTRCFAIDCNVFRSKIDNWQANTPYIFYGHLLSRYSRVLPRFRPLASILVLKWPSSLFFVCDCHWHFREKRLQTHAQNISIVLLKQGHLFPEFNGLDNCILLYVPFVTVHFTLKFVLKS